MTAPTCKTEGCQGDPTKPGAALGLCPRCYRQKHRGRTPTAEPFQSQDLSAMLPPVRMRKDLLRAVEKAARAKGVTLAEWVRGVLERAAR